VDTLTQVSEVLVSKAFFRLHDVVINYLRCTSMRIYTREHLLFVLFMAGKLRIRILKHGTEFQVFGLGGTHWWLTFLFDLLLHDIKIWWNRLHHFLLDIESYIVLSRLIESVEHLLSKSIMCWWNFLCSSIKKFLFNLISYFLHLNIALNSFDSSSCISVVSISLCDNAILTWLCHTPW
jgi:hypothetical protein